MVCTGQLFVTKGKMDELRVDCGVRVGAPDRRATKKKTRVKEKKQNKKKGDKMEEDAYAGTRRPKRRAHDGQKETQHMRMAD